MAKQTNSSLYSKILSNPTFTPALKEQIADVIAEQAVTEQYVDKVIRGVYRHGLLQGPPGLGKSYSVKNAMSRAGKTEGNDYIILKGHCTPLQLYAILYRYRAVGKIVVLDDCDVEADLTGLEILKAATDPDGGYVCWASSRIPVIGGHEVPNFTFKGKLILCTNLFTVSGRGGRRDAKVRATISRIRARVVDFSTRERKFAQIFNLVVNADYLGGNTQTKLNDQQKEDMLTFLVENINDISEIDLRLPQRLAADIVDDPKGWKVYATKTLIGA